MEEQIQQAINDVKEGKMSRIDAQVLLVSLKDDVMTHTQQLVDSGNVNLRAIYLEQLEELNHYIRQLPKVSERLKPESSELMTESIKNIDK